LSAELERKSCPSVVRLWGLKNAVWPGNLPGVKTVTVDDYQRVRLPEAKPRSKFAYETEADGTIRLVPVKAEGKEVPLVKPRRVNGRLRGADIVLSRETVAAAVRADRDER
jgi:hypothetical protein